MTKKVLLCGGGRPGDGLASPADCAGGDGERMDARGAETIGMAQRGGSVVSHVRTART